MCNLYSRSFASEESFHWISFFFIKENNFHALWHTPYISRDPCIGVAEDYRVQERNQKWSTAQPQCTNKHLRHFVPHCGALTPPCYSFDDFQQISFGRFLEIAFWLKSCLRPSEYWCCINVVERESVREEGEGGREINRWEREKEADCQHKA